MRQMCAFGLSLLAVIFLAALPGQPAEESTDPAIELAQKALDRVQNLVEAGALPRNRIQQAEADLADAKDEVIVAHTLYGDLPDASGSKDNSADLVAAAQRRVDRQQVRLEEARRMVEAGVTALSYLAPFEAEMSARQTIWNLARMRAQLMAERALELASRHEQRDESIEEPAGASAELYFQGMERFDGNGVFEESRDLQPLELAFLSKFAHPLPISAEGETELHRTLGFDHRGRVDVAVNPSDPEGLWLRQYLKLRRIPYYAFARAMPGKATAAHIHIGPGSTRFASHQLSFHSSTRPHNAD